MILAILVALAVGVYGLIAFGFGERGYIRERYEQYRAWRLSRKFTAFRRG